MKKHSKVSGTPARKKPRAKIKKADRKASTLISDTATRQIDQSQFERLEAIETSSVEQRDAQIDGYDEVLTDIVDVLKTARRAAARSINSVMTATYWLVGRRIVEEEFGGKDRADYGAALLERLADDLTKKFGRGFSRQSLQRMKQFFRVYPEKRICSTLLSKSAGMGEQSEISGVFPLSWSQYIRLLSVSSKYARDFYESEALRGGWTVRQLERQIGSQFYERTALSRNKAAMLRKGSKAKPGDEITVEEEIKDPYILEFLGLKDEYSESELEEALIQHLEAFLLELGGDFTFIGRQKRLRVGDEWYRIDLVFFHRRLRCLVLIDLKLDKFTHADAGQMHLYCNYARENWTLPEENPPVGLILCTEKNEVVAHYALDGLPNKVMAADYLTALPDENTLTLELEKTKKALERRKRTR